MMIPSSRPAQHPEKSAKLLLLAGVREGVALLGVRGYYRDSMGKPGVNDRGIYDDAIFISTPSCHAAFNANTDPSIRRKGVAVLECGVWRYRVGTHGLSFPPERRYEALVQADVVRVKRDDVGMDEGWFGINIHRGSTQTTSSLGCQTIYPAQWEAFIATLKDQLKRYGQKSVPYLLCEYQG